MPDPIPVTHYRVVTEVARFEAHVHPEHYAEWCREYNRTNPEDAANLGDYLMEGYGDSEYYGRCVAVAPEVFSSFADDTVAIEVARAVKA